MPKIRAILLNNEFDLDILVRKDSEGKIVSGLKIGDSVYQQQTLLLVANKGEIKHSPLVGVGLNNFLLDDSSNDELYQEIGSQFRRDGMTVRSISFTDGKLNIESEYENN